MGAVAKLDAEAAAFADPVTVPLGDVDIDVLPVGSWRSSGLRALREGDFDTWAEKCLTEVGRQAWMDADPTMDEIEAFFTAWSKATGQDPGESRASRRSSTPRGSARR